MFTIDLSNKDYYIILKDGEQFTTVNRKKNKLEDVKKHFSIDLIETGAKNGQ